MLFRSTRKRWIHVPNVDFYRVEVNCAKTPDEHRTRHVDKFFEFATGLVEAELGRNGCRSVEFVEQL